MVNDKKSEVTQVSTDERVDNAIQAVEKLQDELTTDLADVTAENESLHSEADEKEAELSAQDEKIKELEAKLASATSDKEAAQAKLVEIERAKLVASRVRFLQENEIARSTEKALLIQADKCANMSDEDFEVYTEDLLDIRDSILSKYKVAEEEAEKEEELEATVEEIKAGDEEIAASVEEIDEKLRKVLSDEGLLGSLETQASEEESEEEESSDEETSEEETSEEAAEKEIASTKVDYTKAITACFE